MTALIAVVLVASAPAAAQASALKACERTVATALGRCFTGVSRRLNRCYVDTGAPCPSTELERDLARLARRVTARCSDGEVQQLGYGPLMTAAALIDRLEEDCRGEARTLAARTFGGPQGALLVSATPENTGCLAAAADSAAKLIRSALRSQSRCVRKARGGRVCDTATVDAAIGAEGTEATDAIDASCADLRSLVGLDATQYRDRALAQARCMVATAHPDPAPLDLDCGPNAPVTTPPRGQWVQIVLDEAVWGTRCGDGTPYAFWLRLAPSGAPVENVVIDLQGGGVCTNETECLAVGAGLFRATDNYQPNGPAGGYRSTNPAVNPFWDWTMMALSYCTQDVYTGGGRTNTFPGITVHRFGAVNLQASLRYLRDVLWREMDAGTEEGYRPDRLRVLFGGLSAGGFGVEYNYHYLLDDLRWVNSTAVPDSALGLNNGSLQGVSGLGILMTALGPAGWGGLAYLPPYCLGTNCAIVPYREQVTSPRLKETPLQQILNVSNQVDNTQRSTTFFPSSAAWTTAVRQSYCGLQGSNGIRYFLPAGATSLHGMLQSDSRFTGITSDGVSLRDWLAAAMTDPDNVVDLVEEGTLASSPSIDPFPCSVD